MTSGKAKFVSGPKSEKLAKNSDHAQIMVYIGRALQNKNEWHYIASSIPYMQ